MKARFCLLWVLAGCGHAPPPGPEEAIRGYLRALEQDDPDVGWSLLSASAQAHTSREDFIRRWRESRTERQEQAARLRSEAASPTALSQWAAIGFTDGTRVPLRREAGGWRLVGTTLGELRAATPEDALRALAQALESRRYDLLLAVLGGPLRSEVERQLRERLERLRGALQKGAAIEVTGDRAHLQYDPRFRVELKRQDGEWRIYDLN